MSGEPLGEADVRPDGIAGDRLVHVEDGQGRVITARTHPGLLAFRARLDGRAGPLVDGRPWASPEVLAAIRGVAGPRAALVADESTDRFDILPLSVLTDGAIDALGVDRRRLRPNLLIGGVVGLAERAWPGRTLHVGEVVIGVKQVRGRCVMTTYDPDTQAQDLAVLRRMCRSSAAAWRSIAG